MLLFENPVPHATAESVMATVSAGAVQHALNGFINFASYQANGGYSLLKQCTAGDFKIAEFQGDLDAFMD